MIKKTFAELSAEFEKWREHLTSSDDIVEFTDFGAVTPDHDLTQDEMYKGRTIKKTRRELCRQGFKNEKLQKLFELVETAEPDIILELGTLCGMSSLYMAHASPKSIIHTIEGAEQVAEIASMTLKKFNIQDRVHQHTGRFQDILPGLLDRLQTVNCALIDGHHNGEATIKYFEMIKGYTPSGSIIIFDDIRWSDGMFDAWNQIIKDPSVKKISDFELFGAVTI